MTLELPVLATVALLDLLLVAAGILAFIPEGVAWPRPRDARRYWSKYGRYALAGLVVVAVHLVVVQMDGPLTRWLGWDFASVLENVENGVVPALARFWTPALTTALTLVYVVVQPWMMLFAPLLFILSDEERAAKASLLLFPLAYAMALPFFLFFPATAAYLHHGIAPPFFEVWPELTETYWRATSTNNSFPAIHVAIAFLVANATRYSRNVRFRYFAFAHAGLVAIAALYLNVHWLTGVLGGALIAAFAATLTSRVLSVERLALQRVKPEPEEAQAVQSAGQELVDAIAARIAERGYVDLKPMMVGSVAKDTYLANRVDFDVFILFPTSVPRSDLESRGLELGRSVLPEGEEKYAEHPYISGRWKSWDADVVPAYAVEDASKKLSAVDRTPFHTKLVTERMTRDQRDQTRLLKQFMIGQGVYGAEAKTRGASGYLCELLVLKYRSFRGVIRAGAKWKPGTFLVLDAVEGAPRFTDPLVFLDPVDPRRNAASAVSAETLATFAEACRAFLHREGLPFFFPRQLLPLPPEDLERIVRKRRSEFLLVRFPKPEVLEDHLHDQLRKAGSAISGLLERHEFEVKRVTTEVAHGEARLLVELVRLRLPEGVVHSGPPVKEAEHAERFRKGWMGNPDALSEVYEEDGRLRIKRRREFRRAEDLLRSKITTLDLGKHVNQAVREGFTIEVEQETVREDTSFLLTRHFNRKKAWEL